MAALWKSLVIVLVYASLPKCSEAVSQRDVNRVFHTFNLDSDDCKDITDSSTRDIKKAANDACEKAFIALDRIKQNTCHNWRDARCRLISGQTHRQCSCLVSYDDDSNFVATPFRECAKNIASAEPSTRVELAQTKEKRKSTHDAAQTSAKKRYVSINSERYGGVGTSHSPHTSGGADSSQDWQIGSSASTSGSVQTSGAEASHQHDKEPNRFSCTVCPNSYKNERSLNLHMKSHTSNETTCPVCGQVFSVRYNLKTHIQRAHKGTPLPEKSRRNAFTAGTPAHFPCPHCPKRYRYEPILREHLKSHAMAEMKCPFCSKLFTIMPKLLAHIEEAHPKTPIPERVQPNPTELGPFICKYCQTEYVSKKILREHVRSHETWDTHCFECKQTYTNRGSYIKHLKSTHPEEALALAEAEKKRYIEENPEVCGICDKRFKTREGLHLHRLVHEGKTQCEFCGKLFTRVAALTHHKAKAHANEQ